MQIHEITKLGLGEGILKTIGQDIKGAVTEPFQKLQAIANTPGAWTSGTKAGAALDQLERNKIDTQVAQQTAQRAKQLAQQWAQQVKATPDTTPVTKPVIKPLRSGQPTITIGGKLLTKGGDGLWHGETGAAVMDPAQVAKIDKAYQDQEFRKKQFQQTALVREATSSANSQQFVKWSDQQLASTIPRTRQPITMSMVRQDTELSQSVSDALNKVVKSNNDPQAVEEYFVTAMQAMQKLSTKIKQSTAQSRVSSTASGTGLLDQFISDRQLQDIKNIIAQNPATAQQIKTELGIR
jgi:hypothetical protein